jgi:hypothetical protein
MKSGVTVCMPSIPPRWTATGRYMAQRAVASVGAQTRPPDALIIAMDTGHEGVWVTRQRALSSVRTEWAAQFDDDDEMEPNHLERLVAHAEDTGADYVFSYFTPVGMADPLGYFGKPFDPAAPHTTTGVILVRTALAQQIGYTGPAPGDRVAGEDDRFTRACVALGAKIVHLPERTWRWHYHAWTGHPNTSGQPYNW